MVNPAYRRAFCPNGKAIQFLFALNNRPKNAAIIVASER